MRTLASLGLVLVFALSARAGDDAPAVPPAVQYEGKTAVEWTTLLTSEDATLRQKAAYALFKLGPDAAPAAAALVKAVRDADPYVRTTSAKALPRLPADAVKPHVPELAAALFVEDKDVRREAGSVLWRLGPLAAAVVPELTKALASTDEIVRANAAGCLGNAGAAAKSALPGVQKALDDSDENVRTWAAKAVVAIDPAAAFASERTAVRFAALQVYAEESRRGWTRPEVVAGVLKCVDDPNTEVRNWAVSVLALYAASWNERPADWIPVFRRILEKDREPVIRAAAANGLGCYAGHGPEVVPALVAASKRGESDVRANAVLSLANLRQEARSAVPDLLEALRAEDPAVRRATTVALRHVAAPGDAAVIAALVKATHDADMSVRLGAFWSLATVGKGQSAAAAELVRCFGDATSDDNTRASAGRSLVEVGVPSVAIPALTAAFEKDPGVAPAVLAALCELDAPCAGKALERLIAKAEKPDPRFDVVGLIGQLGPRAAAAVPVLLRILSGDDYWRRISAAEALGSIGTAAKDALPALERIAQDPDAKLAAAAKDAIARIRGPQAPPK